MQTPQARPHTNHRKSSGRGRTRARTASAQRQALVAAGVVAIAAAGPAAIGVAAEPDSEHEGSAAAGASVDSAVSPNYEPGGNPTPLPETPPASAAVPPLTASADAGAPDDLPASGDVDDPVVDSGDDATAVSDRTTPAQNPGTAAVTAAPTTPPAPPQNVTAPPTPAAPGAAPTGAMTPAVLLPAPRAIDPNRRVLTVRYRPLRRSPLPIAVGSMATVPRGTVARSASASTRATGVAAVPLRVAGRRARAGDRIHIVLAGESLWAIASDLLGRDATADQVAREVERLWRLNRARIGTGDPDLLFTGTTLVLRYRSSTAR